jgi:acyl carrier protein
MQPVPIGVPGELCIGGAGVARGYINRSELTRERFVSDPFSQERGARIYRTGDLARYLSDGNIELLGRIDHQVKVRGFRIELGEIEAILKEHTAVKDAVVVAREDMPGDKRLVSYVLAAEPPPTMSELRGFLHRKLPDYMVPSVFVFRDSLPLTPNGKIDRQALPAPGQNRPELEETFVAPRTPVEEVLGGIWAKLLHVEQVGIHDNFFDMGGHSLLATQVVSKLREAFGVDLPLRTLFEQPTVGTLAQWLLREPQTRGTIERTAELVLQINRLSDDEVDSLLVEKSAEMRGAQ